MADMGVEQNSNGYKFLNRVDRSHLLFIAVFVSTFILFSYAIYDPDFFWHLKTGEFIYQGRHLPTSDPFTFTVQSQNLFRVDSDRVSFILQQYWVAQVVFYLLYKGLGFKGIVLLRAFVYALLVSLFVWKRPRLSPLLFLAAAATISHFTFVTNERPQLFSYLFFWALLALLESLVKKERVDAVHAVALPALMLLWANVHGAFLLGIAITGIYLLSLLVEGYKAGVYGYNKIAILSVTVSAACFNPSGVFIPLKEFFQVKGYYSQFIIENFSPFAFPSWRYTYDYIGFYLVFGMVVFAVLSCFRQLSLPIIAVSVLLLLMSVSAARHISYLFLFSPFLLRSVDLKLSKKLWFGALLLVLPLLFYTKFKKPFDFTISPVFPVSAAAFVDANLPGSRLFNYYVWGGYLIAFAPESKVYIDGRALVEEYYKNYQDALNTNKWASIFEADDVDTVVIPRYSLSTGKILPLVYALSYSSRWSLVFYDGRDVVFIKDSAENRALVSRFGLNKSLLFRTH